MTDKPEVYRHNGACGVGGDCPHPDHAAENDFPCCSQHAPSCCKSGSSDLLTASEVKVLTETAAEAGRRIGWKAAAEEIAGAIEAFQQMSAAAPLAEQLAMGSPHNYVTRAAEIARDVASQAAGDTSDATSGVPGHPEVSEAVRSPQEPREGS